MFGFTKIPNLLTTRDIEVALSDLLLEIEKDDEAWIITPYATMKKLSSLKRTIAGAAGRGGNISFVVRKEPDQINPAKSDLKEAIANGLKLFALHRLHAKVYWFEGACILTSANLVDGSFESSTEIGLIIPKGSLHSDIRYWIRDVIEPEMQSINGKHHKTKRKLPRTKLDYSTGHCIRCNKQIYHNPERPYCSVHFNSWAKYTNPDYKEKYCHVCGKHNHSTMTRPVCYSCFKSNK